MEVHALHFSTPNLVFLPGVLHMNSIDCRFKLRRFLLAAIAGAGLGAVVPVSAQTVLTTSYLIDTNTWKATEIAFPDRHTYARGINDQGQVIGYTVTAGRDQHAFITGPKGVGITDIGTLGGENSVAEGINGAGRVAGWSETAGGSAHAFYHGTRWRGHDRPWYAGRILQLCPGNQYHRTDRRIFRYCLWRETWFYHRTQRGGHDCSGDTGGSGDLRVRHQRRGARGGVLQHDRRQQPCLYHRRERGGHD